MSSKSKSVRIEQLRIFEKKLALRLEQLAKKGINEKKAQSDPLVKNLKSNIRETNVRITVFEKFVKRTEELAQAKAQKLAELGTKKEEKSESASETKKAEPKPKKADKETKKQPATDEAAPKKPKKKAADADDAAEPKKKTSKKKEE